MEFFRTHCVDNDDVEHGIALAVNEACANAVRHAYPNTPGEIHVEAHPPKDDVMLLVVEDLRRAVALAKGRAVLEASGNATLASVRAIAETGVDYISSGAITHSALVPTRNASCEPGTM